MKLLNFLRAAVLAVSGCALSAGAQTFPGKTVSLAVPYPPGGSGDYMARLIQPGYQKQLGQTVIVENVSGASGALAAQKVLTAPPDGHTQLLGTPMDLMLGPLALSAVKHKPEDFRLAGMISTGSLVLLIPGGIPAHNIDEFIAWAKGRKSISYGSTGHGSLFHLVGEKFASVTGLQMVNVPYKGGSQFFADIVGGQVDMAFWTLSGPVLGLVKQGRLRAIGITAREAHPDLPDVLPMHKHALLKDFTFDLWMGALVTKSTPEPIVAAIHRAMAEVVQLPNVKKGIVETGAQTVKPMNQAQLDKFYADENDRYRELARSINLQRQ